MILSHYCKEANESYANVVRFVRRKDMIEFLNKDGEIEISHTVYTIVKEWLDNQQDVGVLYD